MAKALAQSGRPIVWVFSVIELNYTGRFIEKQLILINFSKIHFYSLVLIDTEAELEQLSGIC